MKSLASHRTPTWIAVAGAMALGLALRLVYLAEFRATPLFDSPGLDAAYYLASARRLAAGEWLGPDIFFMGPLYSYWLAIVGLLTDFSLSGMRLVQIIQATLCLPLVFLIGRRLFDARVGLVATVALAIYGSAIYYDNLLLMTSLVTCLSLLVVWELVSQPDRPSPRRLLASGALLGVAALARASLLAFGPCVIAWLWWRGRTEGSDRRRSGDAPAIHRSGGRHAAWYTAGMLLVLVVSLLRNLVVGGDAVWITSNGGLNAFIGNNPLGRGTYVPLDVVARAAGVDAPVDVSWMVNDLNGKSVAERALGRTLRPSEVSRFYLRHALAYVSSQPGRAAEILGRKLALFWNHAEIAQIEDPELHRRLIPLWKLPLLRFGWIAPLALTGMLVTWQARSRRTVLHLFVLAYMSSVVLFFVTSRYREPVVPHLLLFASAGAFWIIDHGRAWRSGGSTARRRMAGRLGAVAGLLLATGVLTQLDLVHIDEAASLVNLGIAYAQDGSWEDAIPLFEAAVAAEPHDLTSRYNLASAYLGAGRLTDAQSAFEAMLGLQPSSVEGWIGLSRVAGAAGDTTASCTALARAATLAPAPAGLWGQLGSLYLQAGQVDSAQVAYERSVEADAGYAPGWQALTELHARAGRFDAALACSRHAAELLPRSAGVQNRLGILEAMHGHTERAAEAMRSALAADPGYLPARLAYARLWLTAGDVDSARVHLDRARRQAPEHPEVRRLEQRLAEAEDRRP